MTKIRNKVRYLTGMSANEFLSLDRLEQGNVTCAPSEFDLPELCIGLIEELRSMAKPGQRIDYDHTGERREVQQRPTDAQPRAVEPDQQRRSRVFP